MSRAPSRFVTPSPTSTALAASALIAVLAVSRPCSAGDATIEMFDGAFFPQSVTIPFGGTVTWVWMSGDHVVTSGLPSGMPGTPDEPGALFAATVEAATPLFEYTFSDPAISTYHFFDAVNPLQFGTVEIEGAEETFVVTVVDNVFDPDVRTVFAGDTIRWQHEPGESFHTVTSGISSAPEHDPGALFDAESSDANPIFEYLFGDPGEYPYFCIPHEALGMTGLIRVQERFVRGDANRDEALGIADAILTLDHLFGGAVVDCLDALDANDDGVTDLGDAVTTLSYLFVGGPPPPAPFPLPGPDRTADDLTCGL